MSPMGRALDGAPEPILSARELSVRFGPVQALDRVSFELRRGEVHALLGENGAGKSTLIKCLSGIVKPTSGQIRLEGRAIRPDSPHHAEALGIATVFQEVGLIPHLSVAENICLGREPTQRRWPHMIDWRAVRALARAALSRLGLPDFDVNRELSTCSIALQQMVAVARALSVGARVLILDEPTSSLDRPESARLLGVVRQLRDEGLAIVFISHFLDQVAAVADRMTILRDGALVGTFAASALTRAKLIALMVGREFSPLPSAAGPTGGPAAARTPSAPLLSARGLGRSGALESVDVEVASGEVVGLAGLLGSGRSETARLLFGADTATRGECTLDGARVRFTAPRAAIAKGVGFLPENRKAEGIFPSLSVTENLIVSLRARAGVLSRLAPAEQRRVVAGFIRELVIKTPDLHTPIGALSGGNQQKVLLARWFAMRPRLCMLDEPTRGIDIAAKADVMNAIARARDSGMAILFISSELEEVLRACTRVVVLRERRSIATLHEPNITESAVLSAVAGAHA